MFRGVRARVRRRLGVASSEHGSASNPDATLVVSIEPATLAALSTAAGAQSPRKVGVLIKYTNAFKGWKPRLFTLDTGILTYVSIGAGGSGGSGSLSPRKPSSLQSSAIKDGTKESPGISPISNPEAMTNLSRASSPDRFKTGKDEGLPVPHATGRQNDGSHVNKGEKRRRLRRKIGVSSASTRQGSPEAITKSERDVRGIINIQLAVITSDDSDALRFAIDTGEDIYHLKAASREERDEWVKVLNDAKSYFSSLVEKVALRSSRAARLMTESTDTTALTDELVKPSKLEPVEGIDTMAHFASSSTVEAQLEVEGLAEAAVARKALATELKRVCSVLEAGGTVDDVFREDNDYTATGGTVHGDGANTHGGLLDLAALALHVLQTDTILLERKVSASAKHSPMQNGEVIPFRGDDNMSVSGASDDDMVYFDALSRTASYRTNVKSCASPRASLQNNDNPPVEWINDADALMVDAYTRSRDDKQRALSRVETHKLSTIAGHTIRTELPQIVGAQPKLNIWNILKDSVGKDLSKISIPVGLNEPLSFLQRLAEDIEYSELLDQAAAEPDQYRRLMLVATMVISHYSSTQSRTGKPFNPLLGETFSLVMPQKGNGVRFLAEQVSHHPPVSACYAEGSGASWKYYNAIEVRNKFWGKSLEVFPTGWNHIEIPGYGDHFEFEQVTSCVHNIVVGKMWLDNYGDMDIVNRSTGDHCVIKFQKSGWLSDAKSLGTVSGIVYDSKGAPRRRLSGRWTDSIYEDISSRKQELIWQMRSRPSPSASNSYNMTQWAIALNQTVAPDDAVGTAPTDSRFRPDQRALEFGEYDYAGRLKNALEEGQRTRRQAMEAAGEAWTARWFTQTVDPESGRSEFRFNGEYFQAAACGDWSGVPDLYSCAKKVAQT